MINRIHIENFKSLRNVSLNTKSLNLLIGLNSMGKSSVIQSLLMLRQSYSENTQTPLRRLHITGDLISLGNRNDVFFQNAGENEFLSFFIESDEDKSIEAEYKFKSEKPDILESNSVKFSNWNQGSSLSLFSEKFYYLDANHIPPSKTYSSLNSEHSRLNILGNAGENAPYYLAKHGNETLSNTALHHPNSKSNTLAHELDAWMGEISPGTRIVSRELPEIDLVKMSIQFEAKTKEDGLTRKEYSNEYAPINVGFGIPYVLPLILMILISEPGDLILVENPESHLHPKGQAELGRLLSLAAESGVQIFCETHSDHIINGVRVAVKKRMIDKNHVKMFYFDKKENATLETQVTEINVDKNGELDQYPKGLLDEWGNLMAQLF